MVICVLGERVELETTMARRMNFIERAFKAIGLKEMAENIERHYNSRFKLTIEN
jgi:hypothetical protein